MIGMRKFIFGIIAVVAMVAAYYYLWEDEKYYSVNWPPQTRLAKSPESIEKLEGPVYDKTELRRLFESSYQEAWTISCGEHYTVEYPDFMYRGKESDSSAMYVYYNDISMRAKVFVDEYEVGLEEKYEALYGSAVTKSIGDSCFMMAGRMGDDMRYFEKYNLVKPRTWLYIRVEFPKESVWAADPLLQYVKNYKPYFLSQALRRF